MEEELNRQDKAIVPKINPLIHNEVVDELEETRNQESCQESARFPEMEQNTKNQVARPAKSSQSKTTTPTS